MLKSRRHRTLSFRPPLLLTLMVLIFAAGMVTARLWWMPAAPGTSASPLTPVTATPVPATATPVATPTPTSPEIGDALETLYLDIAPDDFAKIEAKREEALDLWILLASDADFVPATVRLGEGAALPADVRLKGDWADHLAYDKWSFRVEMNGDAYVDGMQVFSLQDPSTRTYLNEWLFMENLRLEDVLAVHYDFVHVVQNGQAMGIYALEEGFAKELLESQGRRESVIIRYDEDLLWQYWAAYTDDYVTPRGVRDFHLIDEFDSGKVNNSPALSAYRDIAVGKLRAWWAGQLSTSEVFDVEMLAKFLALTDVWGAEHAVQWHNVRFYYNPVTTKLEPIAFDTQALEAQSRVEVRELRGLREVLAHNDVHLHRAYLTYLWQFSQPAYLADLRTRFTDHFETLRAALEPEFGDHQTQDGQSVLAPPWDVLAVRQAALRELLSPIQMTYAYVLTETPTGTLWLDVGNILDFPVEIVGVRAGASWLPAAHTWLTSTHETPVFPVTMTEEALVLQPLALDAEFVPYARLHIPVPMSDTLPMLQLFTRIWGMTQTVTQPVLSAYPPLTEGPLPTAPSLDRALALHPYLRVASHSERMLTLLPGTWEISGNLVLPQGYGLRLEAGTTLRFAPQTFLLVRDGPLLLDGTADASIRLGPLDETWWGVLVLNAGAPSFWRYAEVADTSAIDLPGWTLTGGITFYQSPIHLDHCRILGTRAEDGFNVIRAPFEFVNSEFVDTVSDAFDADFCQGVVEHCGFQNIGADGIDVSGSIVEVRDVYMIALGDKGLSVGESSQLTAERLHIVDADFGVVSKDLSQVNVRDVVIEDARIAGLAAYIKKPAYGPASIVADAVTFLHIPAEHHTLIQTGSWIDLDGARIWGVELDVDRLYEKWQK